MTDVKSTHIFEEISHENPLIVQVRMRGSGLPGQLWHLIHLEFWYKPADRKSTVEHLLTRIDRATVG